jgi:hypothetical protein
MDRFLVGSEYASHLTDADLALLASLAAADTGPVADASSLRSDPVALLRLLEHPGAFRTVLGGTVLGGTVLGGTVLGGPGDTAPGQAVPASPFLVFAVSVQRAAAELASAGHVPERTGPRQRVPLFDAPALRDFLAAPARRLSWPSCSPRSPGSPAAVTGPGWAGGRGRGGSASLTRCGWQVCSRRSRRPSGPACTAGSAT